MCGIYTFLRPLSPSLPCGRFGWRVDLIASEGEPAMSRANRVWGACPRRRMPAGANRRDADCCDTPQSVESRGGYGALQLVPKRSWIRESSASAILYRLEMEGLDSARSICESSEMLKPVRRLICLSVS